VARFPPAGDEIVTLLEGLKEAGNLLRVVLEICVHGKDDFSASVPETGSKGRGFSQISAEFDNVYPIVLFRETFEDLRGSVGTAIVDKNQLVILMSTLQDFLE
jgi:hypothetical protein